VSEGPAKLSLAHASGWDPAICRSPNCSYEKFMHHKPCLLLIRHAQSENNALGDAFRVPDPNITSIGVAQSRKLAGAVKKLSPSVLYCSPFLRSLETTRPIVEQTGLTPIVRQDIYEQGGCHSGYQPGKRIAQRGMGRVALATKYVGWQLDERINVDGWYDRADYETQEEARRRAHHVKEWYESETRTHSLKDRVAMVIHADFKMRLLEAFLGNANVEEHFGEIVNTSISQLSLSNGRWKLDYWNTFTHLETDEVTA
jgi:2,3-bisphosphoglycerate-dependent phosphoglycerate mutase